MIFDFGMRLCELRKSKHWTQRQLAKKLNVSATAISRYENNIITPSATIIADMASVFRVSANYLLGIKEYGVIHVETLTLEQRQLLETVSNEFRRSNR